MPGILHKARAPNWPDEPFIVGVIEQQETSVCLGGGADRDACRQGITVILLHMPQASLKLQRPVFILF